MFYRKYRPQTWADLATAKIRETLGKAMLENNWAHAYLLLGSRGTGKTTTARLIAKTVNCLKRKKGEEPCNTCDSCLAITNGSSLDVIEIDAASNTGVDDIRDLREKVKLAPAASKYKVYIIDEVHMLSTSAFNALLKTLEEPPEHVIFVLATTDPQKLPETIISRCLVYDFGLAPKEEMKKNLERVIKAEKFTIEETTLEFILAKANGSHRDAVKFLEQLMISGANLDLDRPDATKLLKFFANRDRDHALEEIKNYANANGKIKDLIVELISGLRDILLTEKGDMESSDARELIKKLIEANAMLAYSPIPSLPLELVVDEWCTSSQIKYTTDLPVAKASKTDTNKPNTNKQNSDPPSQSIAIESVIAKWPEIVAATKSHNHSLHAFLRAAEPTGMDKGCLVIGVVYKFHKERLEEPKNRDILEQVAGDIIGQPIRIKFELVSKRKAGE